MTRKSKQRAETGEGDRQEALVPRRRQLMQHLRQTCGCERQARCPGGGRRCRTSYRRLTASCSPERRQWTVRQDKKPWGLLHRTLLYTSLQLGGAGEDRQNGTDQATHSASLASTPGDKHHHTQALQWRATTSDAVVGTFGSKCYPPHLRAQKTHKTQLKVSYPVPTPLINTQSNTARQREDHGSRRCEQDTDSTMGDLWRGCAHSRVYWGFMQGLG